MNILMQIRDDYQKHIAGDSIQLLMTKKYLEALGVNIEVSSKYSDSLSQYDIIHIFNTTRIKESYRFSLNALKQKRPYVLSTIYWNMKDYLERDGYHISSNFEWWKQSNTMRKEILLKAAALLPNSVSEKNLIKKDFDVENKFFIIPNCSDKMFFKADSQEFVSQHHINDFILCVGRIACRKNQLSLIKALHNTKYKLVFIGSNHNIEYYQACRKAANQNTFFLNEMKYHNLPSAYAAAKVHVMPSWFETPGLSSLEAGLAGCNLVTTDIGCQREYFKSFAAYVDPWNENSIRDGVERMYHTPKNDSLRQHIYENYIWETAAQKTLEAYNKVLEDSNMF